MSDQCASGKLPYSTPSEAHQAARFLRKRGRTAEVYRCDRCAEWHISGRRNALKKRRLLAGASA